MIRNCMTAVMPLILLSCIHLSEGNDKNYFSGKADLITQDSCLMDPLKLVSKPDAEKILGEPAQLADTSSGRKGGLLTFHFAYKAGAPNPAGKTGAVYFLFECYDDVASAQRKYATIKKANEDHGIKVLNDLGDEAYFHTDNENFYFIMIRKAAKVVTMKVNKITPTTSLDEFNRVAIKITDSL